MTDEQFDVAIVGLGPVGALAANLLGQRGIRTLVFDRSAEVYPLPRALGFDHEAMRIFQGCGLAEELMPHIRVYPNTEYRGADGQLISRFESVPEPYPLGWAPNYVFDQPAFEALLRAKIASYPSVEVRLERELVSLEQSDSVAALTTRSPTDELERMTAKYVIAADGGSSTVRRMLGVEMESLDFDEPWVVVDVLCSDEAVERLPNTVIQYCEPRRPTTYVVGPQNHRRWEMMLLPGEDPSGPLTEDQVWEMLDRWVSPADATIWRYSTYVFHSLVAHEWKLGNVMLMGDAAHMTPPFMAQGMVQGLRDAMNLAWKLDLVLTGRASTQLLDTYVEERWPHVKATSEMAKNLGSVICELDHDKARLRDASLLKEFGDPPRVRTRQSLIPGLGAGVIALDTAAAGKTFPQPLVVGAGNQGVRLDDLTGSGFRLFVDQRLAHVLTSQAVCEVLDTLDGCAVTFHDMGGGSAQISGSDFLGVDNTGVLLDWFKLEECAAALVRPDHYVFGSANDEAGTVRLCERLAAALAG